MVALLRRAKGVVAHNTYMYEAMIEAAASPRLSGAAAAIIQDAVRVASDDGVLNPRLHSLGIAGADQVAELVKAVARHRQLNQ